VRSERELGNRAPVLKRQREGGGDFALWLAPPPVLEVIEQLVNEVQRGVGVAGGVLVE
jgi:hypothetical protein